MRLALATIMFTWLCAAVTSGADDGFTVDEHLSDLFDDQLPSATTPKAHTDPVVDIKFNSSQEPLMLFSTGLSIRGLWMGSRINFDVVSLGPSELKLESMSITDAFSMFFGKLSSAGTSDLDKPSSQSRSTIVGVDMDSSSKEVYWVELGKDAGVFSTVIDNDQFESRHRRQFPDAARKTVVDSGLISPEDVALDSATKNIYITDAGLPAIVACTIKHSHCRLIVRDNIHKPRAIIVDSSTGWLMYTDWGDHPGIFIVSMDGKRRETLIDTDIVWPNGLAADYQSNLLYWADARLSKIERVDLVTRQRREIIKESAANPFSLSIFEDRIYWSDWSGGDIRTCDKATGNHTKVIMSTDNIYGIHIYHPSIDAAVNFDSNPCWSKMCSHMCLLAPKSQTFVERKVGAVQAACACPENMALSVGDRATCYETQLSFLLVNVKNYIAQVFPDRIGLRTVEKVIYSKDHIIHDVAPDWLHYRIFFFDVLKQFIYVADLNKKSVNIEQFLPASQSVRGLLYDGPSDNLYWINSDRGTLSMASVKGKFEKIIRKDLERPISMVIDQTNRLMYLALLGSMPHIMRTDIFGNEHSDIVIIGTDIGLPVALQLDEQKQRLYWADARRETIESLDLDIKSVSSGIKLNSRVVHRRRLGTILAFAIQHEHFVWTIKNGDHLYRAKMSDPSSMKLDDSKPVAFRLPPNPSVHDPSSDNKRIVLVEPRRLAMSGDLASDKSECSKLACSHGCILAANKTASCFCPDGFRIQAHNRSNCELAPDEQCEANMFRCQDKSHCILTSWRCDGTADCADSSDELNCHSQPDCPAGDFTCANGRCISAAWHCDRSDDCGDNSDELGCPSSDTPSCQVGLFGCQDGKCIPQLWRCDREKDCADGSDERNCTDDCKPNFFRCKDDTCIPRSWLCDQLNDCAQGEDEANCETKQNCSTPDNFRCESGGCIDAKLLCDGRRDCLDGSDETNCHERRPCPGHMIGCPSDHHCIYPNDICDGHQDCEDGHDERNCTNHETCASYEIQCDFLRAAGSASSHSNASSPGSAHRKCIPRLWLCDGEDDCGDWSDEINEKCLPPSYEHMVTTTSRPCHDGSFPCLSGECIKWSQVCDSEDNCLDGTDEGGRCLVACSINNGGCAQQCRASPIGPSCACYEGFSMSNDTKTCEDVDECQHPGICSQFCYNFKGGYKCTCAEGYLLASDKRHCKAVGTENPLVLFTSPSKILSSGIVRYEEQVVVSTDDIDVSGMDYDYSSDRVFWSNLRGQIWSRSWRKHTDVPKLELEGLEQPQHLAYDWVARNVYFSQSRATIHVCNLESRKCSTLFNGRIIKCESLVVAPTVGLLFWSVAGDESSTVAFSSGLIERAEMDGSHRKTIVSDKIHSPIGLAVDLVLRKVYWTDLKFDEISSVDFNGRGRQNILSYSLQGPAGLGLFEDFLLVSNHGSDTLIRCNKFSGSPRLVIKQGDVKSNTIRVVHQVNQPALPNPCTNSSCSHLCALANRTKAACLCPTDVCDHKCEATRFAAFDLSAQQQPEALKMSPACGLEQDSSVRIAWFGLLIFLVICTFVVILVGAFVLHRQGRLARHMSQLSVSFIPRRNDLDEKLLLNDEE